ncbi:MAG: hypothetical protein J5857_09715 [Treponema sp.]|nr:hypothetical protein [Treponema sp.]
MKKRIIVLIALAALCSVCFARSVKSEMPASWQECIIDGFSYSSPFYGRTAGEIFDENNLITKEDVKGGGTFGVLEDLDIFPEQGFAMFGYTLWTVANKKGMEGELHEIAYIILLVGFMPEYEAAIIYEFDVLQVSTGIETKKTWDGRSYDNEVMAYAAEAFLKMMVKVE